MSWIVVVALRSVDAPQTTLSFNRVAMIATGAIVLGLPGTIALGIWTAILRPQFHPWHGWAIAAIVLWCIATAALLRSFVEYRKPAEKARELIESGETGPSAELTALNRTSTGLLLRALASAAVRADRHRHDLQAGCLRCSPLSGPPARTSPSSCTSSARPSSSAPCSRVRARSRSHAARFGCFGSAISRFSSSPYRAGS